MLRTLGGQTGNALEIQGTASATVFALNVSGGFLAQASSTVSGNFQVSGVLNASSTLLVANLASLTGGYISSGSSTVAGPLQVAGVLSASSTISGGTTTITNLIVTNTSTSTFVGGISATNLNLTGSTATSTFSNGIQFTGGSLQLLQTNCNGDFVLETDINGNLQCGADGGGGGAAADWVQEVNFGVLNLTASNTIPYWAKAGINASNTLVVNGLSSLASITATGTLNVTGLSTLSGLISSASSTFSSLLSVTGNFYASSTVTLSGNGINYLSRATSTIINNTPFAWTIATSTSGVPLLRIDTTSNAEEVILGTGFLRPGATNTNVTIGATGTITNLLFAASSTIYAVGNSAYATSTLTFGQGNNIINFAVSTGFGTTSPYRTLSVLGTVAFDALSSTSTLTDALCIGFNDEVLQRTGGTCAASSQRFKQDIVSLPEGSGLEEVMALHPVSFFWRPDFLGGGYINEPNWNGQQVGFIAEEVQQIDPRLITLDKTGIPMSVRYENLTALLAKGLQELNLKVESIASIASTTATSTPALVVAENGNIGIGFAATATPSHKLEVLGEVAAQGFVNISTREKKKDITYIEKSQEEHSLEVLKGLKTALYRYNDEKDGSVFRMGLIAEESPQDVLAADGKGIDLYKLITFVIQSVKALAAKVDSLANRIAVLEANIGASVSSSVSNLTSLVLDKLTIGSPKKRTGITLYDEVTGEPYCFSVANGQPKTTAGECGQPQTNADQTQTNAEVSAKSAPDTEPPVIILNGPVLIEIEIGTSWVDPNATVTDNVSGNLGIHYTVDGVLTGVEGNQLPHEVINTSIAGEHTIVYSSTDQAGNVGTAVRTLRITDTTIETTLATTTTATTTTP